MPCGGHFLGHALVEGVQLLWSAERQRRDVVDDVIADGLEFHVVAHARFWLSG
jgi:hypothetical protein